MVNLKNYLSTIVNYYSRVVLTRKFYVLYDRRALIRMASLYLLRWFYLNKSSFIIILSLFKINDISKAEGMKGCVYLTVWKWSSLVEGDDHWISPTVKHLWNYAMHVLHKFFGFNINTTAFSLGQTSLHLLLH